MVRGTVTDPGLVIDSCVWGGLSLGEIRRGTICLVTVLGAFRTVGIEIIWVWDYLVFGTVRRDCLDLGLFGHVLNLLFEQIQKHLKLRNWVLRNIQWCLQLLDIWTLNLCISFAMNHSDYFFLCLLCLISYQQELLADFYTPKIKPFFGIFDRNCPILWPKMTYFVKITCNLTKLSHFSHDSKSFSGSWVSAMEWHKQTASASRSIVSAWSSL